MAWRIADSVVRGEIDNRERGRVRGTVWLLGRDQPVVLNLKGNCHPDMAGCVLRFENPNPRPGDPTDLNPRQNGTVGDMTASRKVRVPDCSIEEMMRLSKEGKPFPEHMGNCIYLEWFSQFNGRVVIESADFQFQISDRAWTLTREDQKKQQETAAEAMSDWTQKLGQALEHGKVELTDEAMKQFEDDEDDFSDDAPLDEFEWEQFLKESDKRTDKYRELLEKYKDHPDRDKLVAREMGWDRLEEALEARENAGDEAEEDEFDPTAGEGEEIEPNPLTEGIDWVRNEHGRPVHPLHKRMVDLAIDMMRDCDRKSLLKENADGDLKTMVFEAQTAGAKLAGALNGLAYDREPDGGFIVACLKRALGHLHNSISGCVRLAGKNLIDPDRLESYRKNLFEVREEILALMKRFRG